jgi:NAD(P)-dependent dehydrogenase (short-subunit alcohol dehydrogenase family)
LTSTSCHLAAALAPAGIRVKVVSPGMVETPGGTEIAQAIPFCKLPPAVEGGLFRGRCVFPQTRPQPGILF